MQELLSQPIGEFFIDIKTAKINIAISCQSRKFSVAASDDCGVKRSATEIIDQQVFGSRVGASTNVALHVAVTDGRCGRFVDD